MIPNLRIDPFLDDLIRVYSRIAQAFESGVYRDYNPQYKEVRSYYNLEMRMLYTYVNNGFLVDAESKAKVFDSLEKALELLKIINKPVLFHKTETEQGRLIEEVARLLEMIDLIDILEDDDVVPE